MSSSSWLVTGFCHVVWVFSSQATGKLLELENFGAELCIWVWRRRLSSRSPERIPFSLQHSRGCSGFSFIVGVTPILEVVGEHSPKNRDITILKYQ